MFCILLLQSILAVRRGKKKEVILERDFMKMEIGQWVVSKERNCRAPPVNQMVKEFTQQWGPECIFLAQVIRYNELGLGSSTL